MPVCDGNRSLGIWCSTRIKDVSLLSRIVINLASIYMELDRSLALAGWEKGTGHWHTASRYARRFCVEDVGHGRGGGTHGAAEDGALSVYACGWGLSRIFVCGVVWDGHPLLCPDSPRCTTLISRCRVRLNETSPSMQRRAHREIHHLLCLYLAQQQTVCTL